MPSLMRSYPLVEYAKDLDQQLLALDHVCALEPTMWHWSKSVREVLGLAAVDLGNRLGISRQAVSKLEANEACGAISLKRLAAIADALGCDLVYGFIPRVSLEETARRSQAKLEAARKAHRKMPRF